MNALFGNTLLAGLCVLADSLHAGRRAQRITTAFEFASSPPCRNRSR